MAPLISHVIVVICTTAIGRGVVVAFALDAKVALMVRRMLTIASDNSAIIQWIGWILSGIIGIILLCIWIGLGVDDRIYNYFSPQPAFGSLQFDSFDITVSHRITTGRVDVTLIARVANKNPNLLGIHATISGTANGKQFSGADGKNYVEFSGYSEIEKTTLLVI